MALFAEMYGIPLAIYFLSGWLAAVIPDWAWPGGCGDFTEAEWAWE